MVPDEPRLIEIERRARDLSGFLVDTGYGYRSERVNQDVDYLVAVIREHLKPAVPSAPLKTLRRKLHSVAK